MENNITTNPHTKQTCLDINTGTPIYSDVPRTMTMECFVCGKNYLDGGADAWQNVICFKSNLSPRRYTTCKGDSGGTFLGSTYISILRITINPFNPLSLVNCTC